MDTETHECHTPRKTTNQRPSRGGRALREPLDNTAWDAMIRRLDVGKRDAYMMDHDGEADSQDRMGDISYFLSREEFARLRSSVHAKLRELSDKTPSSGVDRNSARQLSEVGHHHKCDHNAVPRDGVWQHSSERSQKQNILWLGKTCGDRCRRVPSLLRRKGKVSRRM